MDADVEADFSESGVRRRSNKVGIRTYLRQATCCSDSPAKFRVWDSSRGKYRYFWRYLNSLPTQTGTVTYIVSGEKTTERRSDPIISCNEGNWQGGYWALLRVGWWWWIWFAWLQSQSKGPEKSASTAIRILQPKSCLCIEQFTGLLLWRLRLSPFSRRGRLGSRREFLKHQLLIHYIYKLQATSYKLQCKKTSVPKTSSIRPAVSIQYRFRTDRQTLRHRKIAIPH